MKRICFVTENPAYEKILEEKFPNRYGDYLELLIKKAGINQPYSVISSQDPLQESDFEVIICLGRTPIGLLLKLPKSFKMAQVVGKQVGKILPWYSLEHLLTKGRKTELETVELLGKIK